MIKLTGILLLLFISVMAGSFAADGLKARLTALRQLTLCLESMRLMIRYEALEVTQMIRRLAEDEKLEKLSFLKELNIHLDDWLYSGHMSFSQAWRKAVISSDDALTDEDRQLLYEAGDILGLCDCEGQLSVLSRLCTQADRLTLEAKEQYDAKGRLYRALGAVGGALIAVIVI